MNKLSRYLLLFLVLLLLSGCAITHEFGPYRGKVVDKETGEAIEGAVVFLRFYTGTIWAVGGRVAHFVEAVEVLTDVKGEFNIPAQRVFVFRPGDTWDDEALVIIFKPGYGAFPGHPRAVTKQTSEELFPANELIRVELPALNSRETRVRNLGYAGGYETMDIPCSKQRNILKLYNIENLTLGFKPVMANSCGEYGHEK